MKTLRPLAVVFALAAPILIGIAYILFWAGSSFGLDSLVGKGPDEANPLAYSMHTASVVVGPLAAIVIEILNIRSITKGQVKKATILALIFALLLPVYLFVILGLVRAA